MTARTGMASLILELRGMTHAGTADYTIAGVSYWSDDHLQVIMDRHRRMVNREELEPIIFHGEGGTIDYYEYRSRYRNFESGTAVFVVEDAQGNNQGTALYSADYSTGIVTFAADQGGTAYFLTGRSYDLNASAADVWRQKAGQYAAGNAALEWSTDNMSVRKGNTVQFAMNMARYYENLSEPVSLLTMRGDEC